METIEVVFGQGPNLTVLQMSIRGTVVFILAIGMLRISGRRSFGLRMPIDNVIPILMGAIMARGVVGASPFWATLATATVLAVLHRLCGVLAIYSRPFDRLIKGNEKIVYIKGRLIRKNMRKCLVTENDMMEGIRRATHQNSFEKIDQVYVERDGKISVVKKVAV